MQLTKRWYERGLSYVVAIGLYNLAISFHLVKVTFSIKNEASALNKMRIFKESIEKRNGSLWKPIGTLPQMQASNVYQRDLWKWRNRRDEFNNKHIRWKMSAERDKKLEGVITNDRMKPAVEKEAEIMKFVNSEAEHNMNRNVIRNSKYMTDKTLSYSWAVRIPTNGNQSLNKDYFHNVADRLAKHHGLINFGPIGGLSRYYYFVHKNFLSNVNAVDDNGDEKENITRVLESHPEIEWVKHEPIHIRKKRTLEFKDQFFPSQWHLVSMVSYDCPFADHIFILITFCSRVHRT